MHALRALSCVTHAYARFSTLTLLYIRCVIYVYFMLKRFDFPYCNMVYQHYSFIVPSSDKKQITNGWA